MDLHHPGWLQEALASILSGYDPSLAKDRLSPAGKGEGDWIGAGLRVRVLRHVDGELRRSGLVYGFPKLPTRVSQGRRLDKNEAHFLAVLSGKCFIALDVARIMGVPHDRARADAELTMLLAATAGRPDLAEEIHWELSRGDPEDALLGHQSRVEKVLRDRIPPASGDIRFDLPLHNGVAFGEARVMSRLALAYYGGGPFPGLAREEGRWFGAWSGMRAAWPWRGESGAAGREDGAASREDGAEGEGGAEEDDGAGTAIGVGLRREHVLRLLEAVNRERALLTEALIVFTAGQGRFTETHRKLMRREVRRLRFPRPLDRRLREALSDTPPLDSLEDRIRSPGLRKFVLEQLVLTAMLDGEDATTEALQDFATSFGYSQVEVAEIEAEIAEYFFDSEDIFDAFEGRALAQNSSAKLVDRIAREISLNMDRISQEVKETGELTQLLAKAAMGHKLDHEERVKAREQLIDLAKVVPSLAIIAAPGGMLIFAALLKVLPFNLLPSSFQKRPDPPGPARRRRRVLRPRKKLTEG